MRRHEKASTAGSTKRGAKGLGRFFRGGVAIGGASSDAKGSGAPKARRTGLLVAVSAAILAGSALIAAWAGAAVPTVVTGSASNIEKTAARLNGTVNPEGVLLEECKFEYGITTSYGQTHACNLTPAEIGSGSGNVAVNADVTGLAIGTTYHFRLVAKNSEGTVNGPDQSFKTLSPPVVVAEWSEGVVRNEATVKGQINPEGFATTYKLEWGPTASYGNSTTEAGVGSDKTVHTVFRPLTGLEPGTVYHYRFVATNSIGTANGPDKIFTTYAPVHLDSNCANQQFRSGPAAQLPDCRAYEMVSPIEKNGGSIYGLYPLSSDHRGSFEQGSASGEKITYSSGASFADELSDTNANQYISSRGPNGWSTHGINPPLGPKIFPQPLPPSQFYFDSPFYGFSEDLSSAWVINANSTPLTADAAEGFGNLYRRDNLNDGYEALTVSTPTSVSGNEYGQGMGLEFRAVSADQNHQVFDAEGALTPNANPGGNRQVYDFSEGALHLVSVLPNGSANTNDAYAGTLAGLGGVNGRSVRAAGAVSEDGSRIFWSALFSPLYVRLNPDQPQSAISGGECTEPAKACTVQISTASQPIFWTANPAGSKALFSQGDDLYIFDVPTKAPTLVAHGLKGVIGAGSDLSRIYFVSTEALAAGAVAGENNLYLDHDGAMTYVAALSTDDILGGGGPTATNPDPFHHDSYVTPDGRHMAFQSNSKALSELVAGFDNTDALSGEPDMEVYVYEAGGALVCASCNPSGTRPLGQHPPLPFTAEKTIRKTPYSAAAWIPPSEHELHAPRVLTDDGGRLFFNVLDPLVPQDSNGVQDVYEWEAQGVGTCDEVGGCRSLVTTGESPEESEFIDASSDGGDVFVRTEESLDPRDPGLLDIYDVRQGGGFPLPEALPPCVGDACQSAPEPPVDPTPASASFKGAANPSPTLARRSCRKRTRHAGKRGHKANSSERKTAHKQRSCKRSKRRAGR